MTKTYQATQIPKRPQKETEQIQVPPGKMFAQTTKADSSYYDDYDLRPYNPDVIFQKRGNYDLFDEMRQDDQIAAVLTLKKFFILNGHREIESDDEEVKEFLETNLEYYTKGFFDKMLYNILSALDFGFSITEKLFKVEDLPNFGQKIILEQLKTRPPHTFEFDQDEYGDITNIRQHQSKGDWLFIDPKKIIHYKFQDEFDNPYGQSDLNLGVYRAWWSKNAIIKFWNIYLERFGMPTVTGKYPTGQNQYASELNKALKNIQAKSSIVVPDWAQLDLLQVSKGGEGYEKAIDKYNTMIARKMLVPDLMGMSGGETGGGSYALGSEQFDMFYNNIMHERKNLERVINKEIIFPLVMWNFGKDKRAEMKFSQPNQQKRDSDLRLWFEAVNSGKIPVTNTHINWFLNQVNAPEIDESELAEIEAKKEEMREAIQGGSENKEDDKGMAEKSKKGDEGKEGKGSEDKGDGKPEADDNEKEDEKKNTKRYTSYYRQLTEFEKRVDFTMIEDESTLTDLFYISQMSNHFKIYINGLIDDIRKKRIVEGKKLDLINKLSIRGEKRLVKILRDLSKTAYGIGLDSAEESIKNFNLVTSQDLLKADDVAKVFEQHAFNTASNEYMHILSRVKPILIESIRNGTGTREAVRQIDEALKGYDMRVAIDNYEGVAEVAKRNGYSSVDDMLANASKLSQTDLTYISQYIIPLSSKTGKYRLETIVRTVRATALNEARLQRYQPLVDEGTIVAYQYSAILDGRTTALCMSLDETIFPVSEAQYYNPPNHYQCRSLLVPVFNFDEYTLTEDMPATKPKDGDFLELKGAANGKGQNNK